MDEDGLYTANPKTESIAELIKEISFNDLTKFSTTANTYADVTKGMEGKIETIRQIAEKGIDTYLINGNFDNRLYLESLSLIFMYVNAIDLLRITSKYRYRTLDSQVKEINSFFIFLSCKEGTWKGKIGVYTYL